VLFTNPTFLVVFLPVLLAAYFLAMVRPASRMPSARGNVVGANWILLIGCLLVYVSGGGTFTWVIVASAVFNYAIARIIDLDLKRRERDTHAPITARAELLLAVAVTGNVMLLGIFKTANPLADEMSPVLTVLGTWPFAVPALLVPLGLSFFSCHAISYLVDIYRRDAVMYKNPVQAVLYLLFFPLLIAGPIVRYGEMSAQLVERQVSMAAFAYGVRRFAIGLGKVFLIAHTLAVPADTIFEMPAEVLEIGHAWFGLICFTLQIYFDLSGYTDMAIGLGRMVGFRLPENFRYPYTAGTVHEFWRRWNISLFGWIQTYVAFSLDGHHRGGSARVSRHLFTLFLLVGLWHGPAWNVVRWGFYHGTFVVLERVGLARILTRLPTPFRHAYLLLVITLGWTFFRTDTLASAILFIQALSGLHGPISESPMLPFTPAVWFALAAGVFASVNPSPKIGRWRVTVDAMTTSVLMLMSTIGFFVWRRGSNVVSALVRRGRRGNGQSGLY